MPNYGFKSTAEVEYDRIGLPIGEYKVMIESEEDVPTGVKATFKILTGDHKGETPFYWFNTLSENPTTQRIAKQNIKRIADATGIDVDPEQNPLTGRVFCVRVEESKNPQYTEIKEFLHESHIEDESPDF